MISIALFRVPEMETNLSLEKEIKIKIELKVDLKLRHLRDVFVLSTL